MSKKNDPDPGAGKQGRIAWLCRESDRRIAADQRKADQKAASRKTLGPSSRGK